jgi:hypothetical protein
MVGKTWKYAGEEKSDDRVLTGFSADVDYAVMGVPNT